MDDREPFSSAAGHDWGREIPSEAGYATAPAGASHATSPQHARFAARLEEREAQGTLQDRPGDLEDSSGFTLAEPPKGAAEAPKTEVRREPPPPAPPHDEGARPERAEAGRAESVALTGPRSRTRSESRARSALTGTPRPARPSGPSHPRPEMAAQRSENSGPSEVSEVSENSGPSDVSEISEISEISETEASLDATMAEVLALEPAQPPTPLLEPDALARLAEATAVERSGRVRALRHPPEPPGARSESLRVRAQPPALGEAGRYTILGSIHRGGMGEILLARLHGREGFSRKVVLKGLLSRLAEDDVSYQLFLREARVMAALEHPNIVRVFDLPYIGDKPFLAMEYVRGRNFHQFIHRSSLAPGGMPLSIALHVVAELLRGLHSAHHAKGPDGQPLGVVHRDVSPGNVLIGFLGEVKVTDFGIAQIANAPRFTGPRSVRGKARYVAPEQIHGQSASVASDVYSAGVVLAEALLGRALWERGSIPETLLAIISEDRDAVVREVLAGRPELPELEGVLRSALALEPQHRFESALAFAEALESIAHRSGEVASHVELGRLARRLFRDAPDLPHDDGFAASLPPAAPPLLAKTDDDPSDADTNPTVISLEPGWAKAHAPGGAHATDIVRPRDPSRVPAPEVLPDLEGRPLPRRTSIPPARPAPPRARSSLRPIDPPPVKIRAVALPVHAAVVERRSSARAFAEGLDLHSTDEESSRGIEAQRPPAPSARRARAEVAQRGPEETRLFLAGLFIGAALAVAGILLALLFWT